MQTTRAYIVVGFLFIMVLTSMPSVWASELHDAAKTGNIESIQHLLAEGYGANEADEQGNLPLHYAAANGHVAIVKLLTDRGANLDSADILRGWTALQIAIVAGKIGVMETLLSNGANVDAKARTGETALHIATQLRNSTLVKILIQHDADLNVLATYKTSRGLDGTPLHWATQMGNTNIVDQLVTAGADMNIKNSAGLTPSRVAHFRYFGTRNSIYYEISRLLKIRLEQRERQQQSPTQQP
tara:strand:+ start:178 stop:903 length:726 start_codon:yes stop_codon:yes gene_type:complete